MQSSDPLHGSERLRTKLKIIRNTSHSPFDYSGNCSGSKQIRFSSNKSSEQNWTRCTMLKKRCEKYDLFNERDWKEKISHSNQLLSTLALRYVLDSLHYCLVISHKIFLGTLYLRGMLLYFDYFLNCKLQIPFTENMLYSRVSLELLDALMYDQHSYFRIMYDNNSCFQIIHIHTIGVQPVITPSYPRTPSY